MYSWVEQKSTIKEAESNYTVQGFDLSYVGVIISLFYPIVFYFLFIFNKDHTP
ncbi:DNA/RNA helicase domain-containing protein [Lysinibacillus sp. fls2-241-R2A-57]|uniref:DNA/RNA helicase domain-containing protein n=1 Tax=Lysinibacillus sp. fls2-241-R2A-57 TaxID=3040292 RepID=UPI002556C0A8|nr:DNA/RNA helicase domain-containing protein [Lysinibacillus sp. fls2-241-R2A-57]